MIGMGGLGAPAGLYLAAAGIGGLVIVDPDRVELSNLQRQVLFTSSDCGRSKVDAGLRRLTDLNPHVETQALQLCVDEGNAGALVEGFDLVLDGTDDFATRFAVSDACLAEGKTLVSGAIARWTGQVGVFPGKPCYRCLVPDIPPDADTCVSVGVIGALGGVIGSMMALEAVKVITGAGEPLAGRLLIYDALAGETRTVRIGADPDCPACA
jgi:molybdopterin/thiamine biosynthesis adenylyltransferase